MELTVLPKVCVQLFVCTYAQGKVVAPQTNRMPKAVSALHRRCAQYHSDARPQYPSGGYGVGGGTNY